MNKIPITVGVIGHLDAIITKDHKIVLEKIFNDIDYQYPNSPVVLFSQLAKGADTEVAKLFIEIKEKTNRDYQLIVPLPYNEIEYKKEFNKDELKTYEDLISKSGRKYILKNDENFDVKELYRKGGQFVADSSIILIAIWDKNNNGKKGGTADIVKYKIDGTFRDNVTQHIFDLNGSLIELECNRNNVKEKRTIKLENNNLRKLISSDKSIGKALKKIDDFNLKFQSIDKIVHKKSCNNFYPDDKLLNKPNETLKNIYCSVDTVTISQQKSYKNWVNFFFGIGLLILIVFEIYKHKGLNPYLFYAVILLITSAYSFYYYSVKNKSNHKQFIEDRIIAESLRIQFFWNISDLRKNTSNHILRIHKTEYNWIKHILSSIYGYTYDDRSTRDETISDVKKYWIVNQKKWFRRKLFKYEEKQKKINLWSKIFFSLGIIILITIAYLEHKHLNKEFIHWLVVLDSVLLGIYALIKAYVEKQGFEQIENQYTLMKSVYVATEKKMNKIENSKISKKEKEKQLDTLLFLVGKEALIENGNWYLIFKEKNPEIEAIGG